MYSYGPPHMAEQKQDDQLEHTHSSSVRIRDVALKICQRRWTIGKRGERGSGISVLTVRYDDDDDCSSTRMAWLYITKEGWLATEQRNQIKSNQRSKMWQKVDLMWGRLKKLLRFPLRGVSDIIEATLWGKLIF